MEDIKQYAVDTNAVRYKVNKDRKYSRPARRFWDKAIAETKSGEAVIFMPQEVIRELNNQSFSFKTFKNIRELENIADILKHSQEIRNITSSEIEELIIEMSAFIGAEYRQELKNCTGVSNLKYPGIPDARILCTAWQRDCIMVTGNISDFVLLPLLLPHDEDKLYNILSESYIKIPQVLHNKIHSNPEFKSKFQRLVSLISELDI